MSKQNKKLIESEYQIVLDITNSLGKEYDSYLSGAYGSRRKEAILHYSDRAEKDFKDFSFSSMLRSFIKNELLPIDNYNHRDMDCDIRIGATLWILEKLRAANCLSKAFQYLQEIDEWYLPNDFYHPCFSYDLIQAMIHVITTRYKSAERNSCIMTEENARGKKPGEKFQKIIELIPREDVERACGNFKSALWEITTRYMKGDAYYYRKINEKEKQIQGMPTLSTPGSVFLNNQPLGSAHLGDRPMGIVNFLMKEELDLSTGGNSKIDLMQEKNDLIDMRRVFTTEFRKFLGKDRKTIRRYFGSREVTDVIDGFTVDDP